MNNKQMLAAVLALPDADLMTATKIDDPIGAGTYYRADNVVRMLQEARTEQRERCATLCDKKADDMLRAGVPVSGPFRELAHDIRKA